MLFDNGPSRLASEKIAKKTIRSLAVEVELLPINSRIRC
jgi:hypothetical protein